MKYNFKKPPRIFFPAEDIELHDCGEINLNVNEQLTFIDETGLKSDFTRKEWGYYLANGLNHKIKSQGHKTALFASKQHSPPSIYVCLVAEDKVEQFNEYLVHVQAKLVMWLDEIDVSDLFSD